MEVMIDDNELEKIYETGKSSKLTIPDEALQKFFSCVEKISAANNIHDLWRTPSLKFEKLGGTKNSYSMRLNRKWRLEMRVEWENSEKTIGTFYLERISNHYS